MAVNNWVLQFLLVISFLCFLCAVDVNYPSPKLSTSWINNDLNMGGRLRFDDGSILRPVLLNHSATSNGFPAIGCGFCSNRTGGSFFFVIFAVGATDDTTIYTTDFPVVLWTANRANPVGENATLNFTSEGDLVLRDADGTFVWSCNTSGRSVAQMIISSDGNLMLVDLRNSIIWQSWDTPTDTFFPGQILQLGQRLIASVSSSNWNPGQFYLSTNNESGFTDLFAFIESSPPQMYGKIFKGSSPPEMYRKIFNGYLYFNVNTRGVVYYSYRETFEYMKLDPDGHLRVYKWNQGVVAAVDDVLRVSLGDCGYPTVCGNYGICSNTGQCSCPVGKDEDTRYFRQMNSGQRCIEVTQLSCQSSQLHHFIELDDVSYFGFTTVLAHIDAESCKQACLKNCSCKAALFQYDINSSNGNCSLPSQIFSLMSSPQGVVPKHSLSYLKVQKQTPYGKSISESSTKKQSQIAIILGPILAALVLTFLIIWTCIRVIRKQNHSVAEGRENNADEDWENPLDLLSNLPMRFAYKDLVSATDNFCIKLGGGGFGSVFEGTLGNGTKIAVKFLDRLGQGRKEFLAEVKTIGSIHHVNLVRLIGFCAEKSRKLLVYEFMSNGSLDKWIFYRTPETSLGWEIRKKIILNIAKGLAYLHEDCRMRIAHLDVKPQNILLDDSFNAKLSDFGLARLIDKNQSQVTTQMRGTRGYMAPEWLSRKITEKVDVYSFGVVVLEIVCGRKNLDFSQPEEDDHLLIHIAKKKAQENRLFDLVDKCSEDMQQHGEEAVKMIMVAIWCLHVDFTRRPSMSMVVKFLEGGMVFEPFSDYSFLTSAMVEAPVEAVMVVSTPQPASILSGPR